MCVCVLKVIECITISLQCKIHQFNGWFGIVVILHEFSFWTTLIVHNSSLALTLTEASRCEFLIDHSIETMQLFTFCIDETDTTFVFVDTVNDQWGLLCINCFKIDVFTTSPPLKLAKTSCFYQKYKTQIKSIYTQHFVWIR